MSPKETKRNVKGEINEKTNYTGLRPQRITPFTQDEKKHINIFNFV